MEKLWEINIAFLIIIVLFAILLWMYLFMLIIGYILRNRFLKKYKTHFQYFGCRLNTGNFLNPFCTYVRTIYKEREFLLMEGEAPSSRTYYMGYRGEFRIKLNKFSPFDLRYKHLPKEISASKDYFIIVIT